RVGAQRRALGLGALARPTLAAQLHRPRHLQPHHLGGERLLKEVPGAEPHRLHRRLDAAERSHDHHRAVGIAFPDPLDDIPTADDLVRPAVRAMAGYTPGEQISDLVKLNTNEGAYPPSPRVMATLAAIADDTLRLYPDPVSTRLRAAAAARFGVGADQILAG